MGFPFVVKFYFDALPSRKRTDLRHQVNLGEFGMKFWSEINTIMKPIAALRLSNLFYIRWWFYPLEGLKSILKRPGNIGAKNINFDKKLKLIIGIGYNKNLKWPSSSIGRAVDS